MNQQNRITIDQPLEFRVTRPMACPYLDKALEQRLAADIGQLPRHHDTLAQAGFRRVENWVYKPICQGCQACVPIRIRSGDGELGQLKISRNQRRVINRNKDLTRNILPNIATPEHYDLFSRYLNSRHHDGQMVDMDEQAYTDMVAASPIKTVLVEYRANDAVIGLMILDLQADGLSAVYSFFDPEENNRSMGTYMVLDAAALAFDMDLPFVYLGYYIETSRKMNYKSRFKPAEVLKNGVWQAL